MFSKAFFGKKKSNALPGIVEEQSLSERVALVSVELACSSQICHVYSTKITTNTNDNIDVGWELSEYNCARNFY